MQFINVSPFHEFLSGMNFILQINVGVVKLTGEAGTGKTALLQELVRDTTEARQAIVAFYEAPASFQQIKDAIREQLGLDLAVDFGDALLIYLLARPLEQRRLILVFDDAEYMDAETLGALGELRSMRHDGHNLIAMVLCGKPELGRILRNAEHRLLAKDILLSYELSPLSSQQLPDFCRACLAARGLESFVLVSDDYLQIMQKSGGLPGKVAELVETYWPEDMETTEQSGKPGTTALPPSANVELRQRIQAALGQETKAAEPKSGDYLRPVPHDVSFDVTPVVAPDISFENTSDARTDSLVNATEVSSDVSSEVSVDASPDVLSEVSADAWSDVPRDHVPEISYNFSYEIANGLTTDVPPDAPPDVLTADLAALSSDIAGDVSTEAASNSATALSSVKASHISAGFRSSSAAKGSSDESRPAVPPDHAASTSLSRQQIISGSLLAASVVIAVVISFIRTPDPEATATQPAANVTPAPALPPGNTADATVPAVNVQQFGNTPAAAGTTEAITPVPAVAPPTEIFPRPLGTEAPANAAEGPDANSTAQPSPTADNPLPTVAAVPARPVTPEAIAAVGEAVVTAWTDAWQSQDVAAYLAFYHPDFMPPSQASLEAWQNSRRRTITSQSSISIGVDDFRVINSSGNEITVQFLLTYRGDTYADRTVKQLVLQPDTDGELRIRQEQNLQTEVFDPVIEAASSWMADRTPGETVAADTRKDEPVASQLPLGESSLGATGAAKPDKRVPTEAHVDTILLAASATEIATSRERPAADVFVTAAPADTRGPETGTIIPLIFNLTTLTSLEVQQINDFLLQWAQAWQTQDTDRYFAFYHPDYKAPESPTIMAWHEERAGKITTPASISITLNELEILENNDDNILVELLMEYRADSYADRTVKRMLLSRSAASGWLITMERNLEVETQ